MCIVRDATLKRAAAEEEAARSAPYHENYSKLRQITGPSQLAERLENRDLSLDGYATIIEGSASRVPKSTDIAERLAALHDVDFEGDDDLNAPADDEDFRSESELENEIDVDFVYAHVIETSMDGDVPEDLLSEFCVSPPLMFVDYSITVVA